MSRESDKLIDDSESDMWSKKLDEKKRREKLRLENETFGEYVGDQIKYFFDSTNIEQVK